MSDVKDIIVRLPEKVYEKFAYEYSEESLISKDTNEAILTAFIEGTVLPEGHGRIIDENKITKCEQVGLAIKDGNVSQIMVTDAPTIIERDRINRLNNKEKDKSSDLEEPEEDVER